MQDKEFSRLNSQKLDHLIQIIEGSEDSPGLAGRLALIERVLFGKDNSGGLVQQHLILWRVHVWILCSLSGLAGTMITIGVQRLLKGHP